MTPVGKGFWLAVANVFVIACALSFELHLFDADVTFTVIAVCAMLPAIVVGTILGWVAEATAADHPARRISLLALPALGLVGLLASVFDMVRFMPQACIPTLIAATVLERTTRSPALVPRAAV